jgi:hypothetical protein
MAYAKKVDKNQVVVVKALRDYGAQVHHLHMVAKGMPDIMCCYADQTILMEIKDGADKKLTPDQIKLFANWQGGPLHRVNSVQEAIEVLKFYELES